MGKCLHNWKNPECGGGYSAGPPVVVEVVVGIDVVDVVVVVVAAKPHRPDRAATFCPFPSYGIGQSLRGKRISKR